MVPQSLLVLHDLDASEDKVYLLRRKTLNLGLSAVLVRLRLWIWGRKTIDSVFIVTS